jgi:hypothetical protein
MRGLLVVLLALPGCRAQVDGDWQGHIGGEPASMALEQEGATVSGEVCFRDACSPADGAVEEQRLTLSFGCEGCKAAPIDLDLDVGNGRLEGNAFPEDCDDDCPPEAAFWRPR